MSFCIHNPLASFYNMERLRNTKKLNYLTWAEVDLIAIAYNLNQIKRRVSTSGAGIIAVVKDNAYGHGAIQVARVAAQIPVEMLAVATVGEAIELRQAGIDIPILVLCCILPEQAPEVVKYDITQTICDVNVYNAISKMAVALKRQARVHIKVDTGMGRIGVKYNEVIGFVRGLTQSPNIIIEGIYTHFASADGDTNFTKLQIERFRSVLSQLDDAGFPIPIKHAANSAAILGFPESFFNMVRPGLIIYGLYPEGVPKEIPLIPALSLKTRIVYLKELPPGWTVSYNRTYTTNKRTMVASLAMGYGQGYSRRLSNVGEAIIRGKKAPIIGIVCMDQCLCDVTHIPEVSIGDEAVLIGTQGDKTITADEIAEKCGYISYEVLCQISPGVPRIYQEI